MFDGELERDGRMSRQVTPAAEPPSPTLSGYPDLSSAVASLPFALMKRDREEARNRSRVPSTINEIACSAGILVVGDEVLNGKVRDCNAHYLCGMLHSRGVCIKRIEMVPDDIYAISEVVQNMCATCDFVFTSGGLGPTHDDVTVAGVAAAFKCRLIRDEKFFAMLSGSQRKWSQTAQQKMAIVPEGATVEWPCDGNPWPILSMNNCYVFAGMPAVCRSMFERAASDGRFTGANTFACVALRLDAEEAEILDTLQSTVEAFSSVHIGSYPSTDTSPEGEKSPGARRCSLTITFEAFDADIIEEARAHLKKGCQELRQGMIVD